MTEKSNPISGGPSRKRKVSLMSNFAFLPGLLSSVLHKHSNSTFMSVIEGAVCIDFMENIVDFAMI